MPFDTASLVWTLQWDADWVTAVTFIGPSRTLAAGNNRGEIVLWELPEKRDATAPVPIRRLDGHTNVITRLLGLRDGRTIISSSYDHSIRYWDVQSPSTGEAVIELNAEQRRDLIARKSSKVPAAIEVKVGIQNSVRTLNGHREWVSGMALTPDEQWLLSADDAGEAVLWNRAEGKEVRRWNVKGWAQAVGISPDAKQAAISERVPLVFDSGQHTGVRLWDISTGKAQHDLTTEFKKQYIAAAAYSADGKVLALGRGGELDGPNGRIVLFDPATGKKLRECTPGHLYGATDVAFHPDGKHLASAGRDTIVRLWNIADGKMVKELGKPRGGQFKDWLHALSFSADGQWLAAADMAGAVQVWFLGPS